MKFKKRLALALSVLLSLSMAGCGKGDDSAKPTEDIGTLEESTVDIRNGFLNTSATDDFGRSYGSVSDYESKKYVGLFYFLWNGVDKSEIKDISGNYEKNGTLLSKLLVRTAAGGTPELSSFHYWGKPLYGYYNSDDKWVIRKHIELFMYAGIDFVAFDTTNARIYNAQAYAFLDTLAEYAKQGFPVPKVVFVTNTNSATTVEQIYNAYYDPAMYPEYKDLWFCGNRGVPWIIGERTGNPVIDASFYFKQAQWPNADNDSEKFPWMDWDYPQKTYTDDQIGNIMSVSVSQHVGLLGKSNGTRADFSDSGMFSPSNRKLFQSAGLTYSDSDADRIYNANWGRGYSHSDNKNDSSRINDGTNFEEQWQTVHGKEGTKDEVDLVFVTGWNEWIAQKQINSSILGSDYCHFVDTFNTEFSRDIEMNAEYLDNFYLQLVRNVRKFKGKGGGASYTDSGESLAHLMTDFDGWNDSAAVYRSTTGNTEARDAIDSSGQTTLRDTTGRNDIKEVRVMSDSEKIYFLIRTQSDITAHADGDEHWMNLFLGVEGETDGWQGLRYVVNRTPGAKTTSLHKVTTNSFAKIGDLEYTVSGIYMCIAMPKSLLGITGGDYTVTFKIADNLQSDFDVADLYVSGDVAPLGRIKYVYKVVA